jgi:two-component system chemotaxis response regulator CheB
MERLAPCVHRVDAKHGSFGQRPRNDLARQRPGQTKRVPDHIKVEALIAERVLSDVEHVGGLGPEVPYNSPNCGGVLGQVDVSGIHRYRCHTGHSFTAAALLTSQTEKIEETLWISIRMFEERKNLLNAMAKTEKRARTKLSYTDQAKATEIHLTRIRAMLMAAQPHLDDEK